MSTISVITPVYNSTNYLKQCIDTIIYACHNANQSCEIILIDDGGNDDSSLICDQYSSINDEYVEIIVIHQKNSGQATGRNRAINVASGEWISFVDSDDYIHPQMLQILYDDVLNHDVRISMVGANFNAYDVPIKYDEYDNHISKEMKVDESFFIDLYNEDWQDKTYKNETIWGKLIRKDIVTKYPFSDGHFCEDAAIMSYWFKEANIVSDCSFKLYYYRDNPNGTMNTFDDKKRDDKLWSILETINFCKKNKYKIMKEKIDEIYLWQLKQYEEKYHDNRYAIMKRRYFIKNVWSWNCSIKKKVSLFIEYVINSR